MMDKATLEKKKELQKRREHLASALEGIKNDYTAKNYGEALKIVGPLINSMAAATSAQAIRRGSPSLLLGLKIALIGIESEKSQAGVIGKTLSTIEKGVADLVIGTYLAKEDVGSREFFKLLSQALMLASISIIRDRLKFEMAIHLTEEGLRVGVYAVMLSSRICVTPSISSLYQVGYFAFLFSNYPHCNNVLPNYRHRPDRGHLLHHPLPQSNRHSKGQEPA